MYLPTTLALANSVGRASVHSYSSRSVASFTAGSSWDILLSKGDSVGNVKQQVAAQTFQFIDIDLFDTDKATIADLKSNKQVICYFSAGSREDWRPDASDFKDGDTGKGLDGWPGENWVNVKSDNVRNIMKTRIKLAADNGCNAVDPDNVDGFDDGQDGFGYDKSAYVDYVKFLAQEASNNNLAIGLKNAVDIIPDVVGVTQFAINEQCHEYAGECEKYKPFTDANKAVFNIEYGGSHCDSPSGVKLSILIKPEDQALDTLGGACAGQDQATPANGGNPNSTTAAPSKTSPAPTQSPTESAAQPTATDTDNGGDDDDEGDGQDDEPTSTMKPVSTPTPSHRPSASAQPGKGGFHWGSYPPYVPKPHWWDPDNSGNAHWQGK